MELKEPKPPDPLCLHRNLPSSTHSRSLDFTGIFPSYCSAGQLLSGATANGPSSSAISVAFAQLSTAMSPSPTSAPPLSGLPSVTFMAAPLLIGQPPPVFSGSQDNFFFYHCGFGKAFGQFDVAGCLPTLSWEEAAWA